MEPESESSVRQSNGGFVLADLSLQRPVSPRKSV
jgi:hypothetical protein